MLITFRSRAFATILSACVISPLSPAQSLLLRSQPPDINDGALSMSPLADVDGDGRVDILLGQPSRRDPSNNTTGAVALVSGLDGREIYVCFGSSHGDYFGLALARIHDLDGDGVPDFAVGAPESDAGAIRGGLVSIRSGRTGAQLLDIAGASADGYLGTELVEIDDIDNDGAREIAVVSHGATSPVVPGTISAVSPVTGSTVFTINTPSGSTTHGMSLAVLGDTDADGFRDLVVGDPEAESMRGRVWLVSGATGSLIRLLGTGLVQGAELGASVATAGDLDHDGTEDVIVGAPREGPQGRARVLSGANGDILWAWFGPTLEARTGSCVATVDDLDGDSVQDFIVGSEWAALTATNAGRAHVISGATAQPLFTFDGDFSTQYVGALVDAEDIDGDGVEDILVAMRRSTAVMPELRVFSGNCGTTWSQNYCIGSPNSVGPGARIGWFGSTSISASSFHLTVTGCPPNTSGRFIYGWGRVDIPFGNGHLCVGGDYIRRLPGLVVDGSGSGSLQLDLTNPPSDFLPGALPKFQFWYRNAAGGGAGYNLSDAVEVSFCM